MQMDRHKEAITMLWQNDLIISSFFPQKKNHEIVNPQKIVLPAFHIKLWVIHSVKAKNQNQFFSICNTIWVSTAQWCKIKEAIFVSPHTKQFINDRNIEEFLERTKAFKWTANNLVSNHRATEPQMWQI
jgi:hypothetical protein